MFALIVSVFVIRLVMSWAGVSNSYTRWVSLNLTLISFVVAVPVVFATQKIGRAWRGRAVSDSQVSALR